MRDIQALKRVAVKVVSTCVMIGLFVVVANAYTVVMRSGRRVEIPSRFLVTTATLTYEVSDGIQITIPMISIDIPATEKANQEAPGSLLARVKQERMPSPGSADKQAVEARRTITNRDLESSMRRRQASESAYEVKRKE